MTAKVPVMCFERGLQVGFVVGAAFMSLILAAIWPSPAHAETVADKVFGPWQRVTPETILRPVPILIYERQCGAVAKVAKTEPLPASCAIWENGHVVGYRSTCKD